MLIEDTVIPVEALPIAAFRAHLRMGTGFGDDTLQDGLLEAHLRAALAAVEARTGTILLARSFSWTVFSWRQPDAVALPVGPVEVITAVTLVDRVGDETIIPAERWRLIAARQAPRLTATTTTLPSIPSHGHARIGFIAGFGPTWGDVPADLAQAVLLLAAHFYEFRHSAEGRGVDIPADVAALIAPHRTLRLNLGGR